MSFQSFATVAAAGSGRTTSPHLHHSASLIRPFLLPANWLIFQIDYTTCQPDLRLHPECLPLDWLPPEPFNPRCSLLRLHLMFAVALAIKFICHFVWPCWPHHLHLPSYTCVYVCEYIARCFSSCVSLVVSWTCCCQTIIFRTCS